VVGGRSEGGALGGGLATLVPMGYPDLRQALLARYPWTGDASFGPQTVEAGECDGCAAEARLVAPCGPPPAAVARSAAAAGRKVGPDWALGRRCVEGLGEDIWCEGHRAAGAAARAWLAYLPAEADDVARLWWVATGEIRLDPDLVVPSARRLGLPSP
jgi:hypothetical protein